MTTGEHKYLSDFARKYYGEGVAKGEAKGEARGKRASLLMVLAAREIVPDAAQLARINACDEPSLLDRWITTAARAVSIEDIFAE